MSYLADNAVISAELAGKIEVPHDDNFVGAGHTMETYSAGFITTSFGLEIPLAVKIFTEKRRADHYDDWHRERFLRSLAFVAIVSEEIPEIASKLPLFYAQLVDDSGKPIGQVTEDFSYGGQYPVYGYSEWWANRPEKVNKITRSIDGLVSSLIESTPDVPFRLRVDDDFTSHMLNEVQGVGPRIVDLFGEPIEVDPYARVPLDERPLADKWMGKILKTDRIEGEIDKHTVILAT
jgi:hypothetical protein